MVVPKSATSISVPDGSEEAHAVRSTGARSKAVVDGSVRVVASKHRRKRVLVVTAVSTASRRATASAAAPVSPPVDP
jgi:hypothetical protein